MLSFQAHIALAFSLGKILGSTEKRTEQMASAKDGHVGDRQTQMSTLEEDRGRSRGHTPAHSDHFPPTVVTDIHARVNAKGSGSLRGSQWSKLHDVPGSSQLLLPHRQSAEGRNPVTTENPTMRGACRPKTGSIQGRNVHRTQTTPTVRDPALPPEDGKPPSPVYPKDFQ